MGAVAVPRGRPARSDRDGLLRRGKPARLADRRTAARGRAPRAGRGSGRVVAGDRDPLPGGHPAAGDGAECFGRLLRAVVRRHRRGPAGRLAAGRFAGGRPRAADARLALRSSTRGRARRWRHRRVRVVAPLPDRDLRPPDDSLLRARSRSPWRRRCRPGPLPSPGGETLAPDKDDLDRVAELRPRYQTLRALAVQASPSCPTTPRFSDCSPEYCVRGTGWIRPLEDVAGDRGHVL